MARLMDYTEEPIQVHENHAGPRRLTITLPDGSTIRGSLNFNYVAYRDAEIDSEYYGYGNTEEEAIADYVRQEFEEHCATECDCSCPEECILTKDNFVAALKFEMDRREADTTHGEWRKLNKESN